jgi:hypothetical protein
MIPTTTKPVHMFSVLKEIVAERSALAADI